MFGLGSLQQKKQKAATGTYEVLKVQSSAELAEHVSVLPVPQEVLLLRHLVGLAALGRAPPRPWHLEAALATVAQCSAGAAAALEDAVGLDNRVAVRGQRSDTDAAAIGRNGCTVAGRVRSLAFEVLPAGPLSRGAGLLSRPAPSFPRLAAARAPPTRSVGGGSPVEVVLLSLFHSPLSL
jgi:hypothetical protein